MFWCCCLRLHRHQLHLASYGCVSLSLILTGIVFTVFAVFQKDSQIGKVWLAGPVLIVVGAVLCGKVMIDWGPAMERGRAGSVDSRLVDEFGYSNLIGTKAGMVGTPRTDQHLKVPTAPNQPGIGWNIPAAGGNTSPSLSNSIGPTGPFDCIINYGTYSPEVPASPFKCSSSDSKEVADKMTQAKEGCEKCAALWSILDRRKTVEASNKRPKVIGKFVFSELNNGGPSADYGALRDSTTAVPAGCSDSASIQLSTISAQAQNHSNTSCNNSSSNVGRGRRKFFSQGETLIMNERSFLI